MTLTIADSSFPIGLALSSDGSTLYAANEIGSVSVIDTASNNVTESIPVGSPAADSVGTVDVTVTTPAGTSATSSADRFSYIYFPTATQIDCSTGPRSTPAH
jgi:YVTN family beta-propeller protein